MRYIEVVSGLRIPLSEEEDNLVKKINNNGQIKKKELNEREQEIARRLTSRGVLNRFLEEDLLLYEVNNISKLWREDYG